MRSIVLGGVVGSMIERAESRAGSGSFRFPHLARRAADAAGRAESARRAWRLEGARLEAANEDDGPGHRLGLRLTVRR